MGSHGFPITPKQNKPIQADPKHDKTITDQLQSSTAREWQVPNCMDVVSAFVKETPKNSGVFPRGNRKEEHSPQTFQEKSEPVRIN